MKLSTILWLLAIVCTALLMFFIMRGCKTEPETVVIETTSPVQDSLFKAMDMIREIYDTLKVRKQTIINNIDNEINHYSNLPDSVLPSINDELADTLRGKWARYKQRKAN